MEDDNDIQHTCHWENHRLHNNFKLCVARSEGPATSHATTSASQPEHPGSIITHLNVCELIDNNLKVKCPWPPPQRPQDDSGNDINDPEAHLVLIVVHDKLHGSVKRKYLLHNFMGVTYTSPATPIKTLHGSGEPTPGKQERVFSFGRSM